MSAWIWVAVVIFALAAGASLQATWMALRGKSRGAMSTPSSQRRLRRQQRRPGPPKPADDETQPPEET